jgi:hypothetical protein
MGNWININGPSATSKADAIDFFVQVLKLSFHDAMLQIIGP